MLIKKQLGVLSLLSVFCLLVVACFGVSMLAYQQSYQSFYQISADGTHGKLTPAQQKEYTAEMNAIYLRDQFI